jgi:endonuclease/exonuclease/phosphatase family metal-dependent hydrolase
MNDPGPVTSPSTGEASRADFAAAGGGRLSLLNYNIQAGMASRRYADYLLHSWKYFLPHVDRWRNFDVIAHRLKRFDLVAIQETDAGSLRTGFTNPTEHLARHAGFPFWFEQINREVGSLSRHGNAILCRERPYEVIDHKLPGMRGRGALIALFGPPSTGLAVISVHLALGRRPRARQIESLCDWVNDYPHAILMGDFNCELRSPEMRMLLRRTSLRAPAGDGATFPSWRPRRRIDHILVTPDIEILDTAPLGWTFSDHLPVRMDVRLPEDMSFGFDARTQAQR